MIMWLIVGACGGALSTAGLLVLHGLYRSGEIPLRILIASLVGFLSLATYAVLGAFRPETTTGPVTIALLLPAVVSILVLIRGRRKGLGEARGVHGAGR